LDICVSACGVEQPAINKARRERAAVLEIIVMTILAVGIE
jgi:hypothetical protein